MGNPGGAAVTLDTSDLTAMTITFDSNPLSTSEYEKTQTFTLNAKIAD